MSDALLLPLLSALFILIAYFVYYTYQRWHLSKQNTEIMKSRISQVSYLPKNETTEDLRLIKEDKIQETFLQSKLPKVEGLKQWLQHAGLSMSPTLFVFLSSLLALFTWFVFIVVLNVSIVISILLGIIASFLFPWLLILFLTSKRKNAFLAEFPVALDVMRRALKAGFSSDRSLEMVAEQQTGKIGRIFKTIGEKMRLGEPVEVVLADMANRIGIDEFRMLAIVLVLHRETGGSLAEAMDNFSTIIRTRQNLRKKIKALTAEVRLTAIILTALPFFILGTVFITSPRYLDTLFYTDNGQILLIIGGVMLFAGVSTIIRMAYKDIY